MVKFPINTKNYPIFIASFALILIGIGLGNFGVSHTVNSIWSNIAPLLGYPVTQVMDTTVSSMYIASGFAILIVSLLAYLIPKIIAH